MPGPRWTRAPYLGVGQPGFPQLDNTDHRYRVGVRSLYGETIPNVRAVIVDLRHLGEEPLQDYRNALHKGHELAVMGTAPPKGEKDLRPNTGEDPGFWVDVVGEQWWAAEGGPPEDFFICYASDVVAHVPCGAYELTIRVDGGEQSIRKSFRVEKGWRDGRNKRLDMGPMP